jgi:hypothetical protein
MPLKLSWAERQIFLKRDFGPGPILDMFAPLAFKVLQTAWNVGIFRQLAGNRVATAQEIAKDIHGDEYGVKLVCETLVSLGYLSCRSRNRYVLSRMSRTWMVNPAGGQCGKALGFFDDAAQRFSMLEDAVCGKRPDKQRDFFQWQEAHAGAWDRYHEGMMGVATLMAGPIISRIRLPPGAGTIIDIGGSHGLYAITLCRRNPELSAVIFDQPQARPAAEKTIRDCGMEGRVEFREGDILRDDPGGPYDCALVFNMLRTLDRENAERALANTYKVVRPRGMVVVADQFCGRMATPFERFNATMILLELYNSGATLYGISEVKSMLRGAGFENARAIHVPRSPGIHIVAASRCG